VEEPNDLDHLTLSTVPTIYGPNGARVKLSPAGKTVRRRNNVLPCHLSSSSVLTCN
jgi:hypothetical protein